MDSRLKARPARKAKRYRLVPSRPEAHGTRIKRFRLMQMDRLALDSRSNPSS